MAIEILIILMLVLVNGLFSGAEIATVTLRRTRIEQLIAEGKGSARAVQRLRSNPERFLATVQVGITVVGMAAAAYGGDTLAERIAPLFEGIPFVGAHARQAAFVIVVAGISYLSLVLGELVPKSLALRSGESYALLVARPLLGLAFLAKPVVWLLTLSSNLVLRMFGDRTSFTEARVSPDELKAMLEEASEAGALHPRVGEIAARAIELSDLRATDVMVPRRQIRAVEKGTELEALRALVANAAHSKLPVYEGSIDNVVGVACVRDIFTRGATSVDEVVRPITFVPETMRAVDVLFTLQTRGAELAIVVDEHGGTAGLLTREDLSEELFGEVAQVAGPQPDSGILPQPDGSLIAAGGVAVRDVNRGFDLNLPEHDDWSTISGMVVGVAGRIPTKGERVDLRGAGIAEVLDASPRRVRSVRIIRAPPAPL